MKIPQTPEQSAFIKSHGALAREAWLKGDFATAETEMMSCWNILPVPQTNYERSESLARAFVMFFRDTKQFDKAKKWLDVMRVAYGSVYDPSTEFEAGTVYFAAGEFDMAFETFHKLYLEYGSRPFQGSNPEYLAFYRREAKVRKK